MVRIRIQFFAGNGQRNNAESIEVGLATQGLERRGEEFGRRDVVRIGSNASARLNSLYFS